MYIPTKRVNLLFAFNNICLFTVLPSVTEEFDASLFVQLNFWATKFSQYIKADNFSSVRLESSVRYWESHYIIRRRQFLRSNFHSSILRKCSIVCSLCFLINTFYRFRLNKLLSFFRQLLTSTWKSALTSCARSKSIKHNVTKTLACFINAYRVLKYWDLTTRKPIRNRC